ncbi:Tol-Pal system beta propeller repeat protein TolB [Hydrogenovibrio halophilus]|uniref:Tol-Pal system beta propeller repeat protein TolB n=1 Tax=Hydrogenovibrio halophilus TaxID=373391 RepID=UPI001FE17B55|nr:Tol-Pal system beta propeller repeat protein TolB [Hydrogenovibrio halophilus]
MKQTTMMWQTVTRTLMALAFGLFASATLADLTIEIDQSSDMAIPVAILPLEVDADTVLPHRPSEVIAANLFRSGKFRALPERQLPARPQALEEVDYGQWLAEGVDNLMMGRVEADGEGTYTVEMRFVDLLRQKQVIGKRWRKVNGEALRRVAHKMSDLIYEELTGKRGAFNTRIAYVTQRNQNKERVFTLEVADSDGYGAQSILKSFDPIMSPAWSPDGEKLAYVTFENGRSEIALQHLDGSNREIIASFKGINGAPAWSPDGESLVFTNSQEGSADLYRMQMATRKIERLTRHWAIETEAVWAPNGRSLYFNSDRRGQPQIFQLFLDTGETRRISFDGRYNSNPAISPDGRYLAMVHANRGFHIAVKDMIKDELSIKTQTQLDESPTFAPNGEMLLYAMNQDGRGKLAVVSVDNNVTQVLSVKEGEVRSPSWGPYLD